MSHSRGRCRNRDSCCIGRHRASPSESPTAANHPREKSGPRSSSLFLPFWPPFPLNKSNDPRETWLRSSSVLRLISSCCLHVAQEPAIIAHFLHSAIAERRNDEATAAKSRGTARDTIPVHERSPHAEGREGFGSIRNGSCHIQREAPVSRVPAGVSGLNSTGPACALENNRDACGFRNTKVADTNVSASRALPRVSVGRCGLIFENCAFDQPKLVATHLCLLFGSRQSRHYARPNTFMGPDP